MHKKTKKRLPYLLFVIVFMLSFSVSTSFFTLLFTSNNDLDEDVDLETSGINTLYNGKSYPFELRDVYDDENNTKIYTAAYLQTEHNQNGTIFNDTVTVVNNTNYKSPYNTDVTMINGTFDDTDNMRANDDSNTEFTSAGGGEGSIYVDPDGDGTCQWQPTPSANHWENVLSAVREPGNPGTSSRNKAGLGDNNKIDTYTFGTATVGSISQVVLWHYGRASTGEDCFNQIYIGGGWTSYVLCGFAATAWKSRVFNGDWDQTDLDNLQVRYKADSNYGEFDYTYLYAVYCVIVYSDPTELNFTIDLNFNEVDTSKLLALDVSSHHYTNVSTTIKGNIYDYDSSSYIRMFSSDNIAETENYFSDESSVDDYLDGSGNLELYFTGIGSSFKLSIDYIRVRFYYKMDIIIYKTFYVNGLWRYRFKIVGSLHYTDWTYFEVIDPTPNFYAISESELTTRWILQNSTLLAIENFHDDINTDYWNLIDVSEDYFTKVADYLLDNSSMTDEIIYSGVHFDMGAQDSSPCGITWDGTNFWVLGDSSDEVYQYTSEGTYTGTHFDVGTQDPLPSGITWDGTYLWVVGWSTDEVYKYNATGTYTGVHFDVGAQDTVPDGITWDGTYFWMVGATNDEVYKYTDAGVYTTEHFNIGGQVTAPSGITWDGTYLWVVGWDSDRAYKYNTTGTYMGTNFYVRPQDAIPKGIDWDGTNFWVVGNINDEVYKYEPKYNISKNYFGSGYTYMQTDVTELISLKSIDYTTHYNLSSGDYFEIDFQTSSDSQINLILMKDGVINKTLILSASGNTNFNNQTAKISVDEFVEFDQLKISSTFEDTDNIKIYDIKTYKYTITGDYADFYVGSKRTEKIYLTPDTYNLRIFEGGDEKVNENVTIPETGILDYVYTPIETLQCRLALFNTIDESLEFTDYHITVNRSLNGVYNNFDLLESIFLADEDTYIYINVSDRFDTLIDSFERLASEYMDLEIEVYQLQLKNLMEQQTTININSSISYPLLSLESIYFMLSKAHYQIGFYDEYNVYTNFTIYLSSNQAYQLNSSLKTIYFSVFTYDGLGIDHDLVRFYINGERKDFGFNSMLEDTLELIILDFFNNTLANETIDANAYSEYNLFVEIYSMIILNQFTYEDILVNITQVGSGIWMAQVIPKQFGLTYRFLPNVEYNITVYFTNATLYSSRIVNLTDNSHIESFGVPTLPEEYPKNVYFGVYTTTGLGIDPYLLRFYIDGTRADFGFNRIENQMVALVVKDYFNSTLFNQNINTSGIYEYNILITLYSLKVKNEARIAANYTLKLGGLETTGFILPEEIIEYQLATNNYVFDYTNNEDNSFHTININLNQDRVYILNSTYYNIYFSLFDLNLHLIDSNQYEFRLNGTREAFGFVEDLSTDDYIITVIDRFGTSLFNTIVNLRGLNEYVVNISLYELQIRHLASENSNITLYETTGHNSFNFSMSPDSLRSLMLGSSTYNITWLNGENSLSTIYDITLSSDYILTLNSTYYDVYFSLYDQNGVRLDDSLFSLYINGSRKDFGFVNLESTDILILVQDRLNFTAFNSVITLSGFAEYNIIITVYELQIRHLARENGNLTLSETTGHSSLDFNMAPDSLRSFILGSSTYNVTWLNNENGITTTYDINLISDYILTLNTSYYDIYFSLFDLNLHTIDLTQYEFRLNGTLYDFGLITDLQTNSYTISVIDRFETSLFNTVVTLRGLNEYRINISLYELQIRHLATENSNMSLYETTGHNSFNFSMAPDTIKSIILGSSTYNITWINGENGLSAFYDINLTSDYILTLNTTFYDVYFSLYDQNGVRLDDSLFSLYINGSRKDFGFIELETDSTRILVQDRLNVTVFNHIVGLSSYAEYNIIITVFELQIRHLGFENSNITLYETTSHNYLNFSMAPDTIRYFILADSTYNITWVNGENGVSTLYNIILNENYILLLDTTYYSVYIGLYNFYGIVNSEEVKFYINNTRADFGFNTIKSEYVRLIVLDYFNSTLFNRIVRLEGLTEYSVFIRAYTLVINNLYNEKTITIRMTRGTITIERLIEAQGYIEIKLFANATYEIISYINGTLDEEKEIELDEEYKTVDFGFYETEVPIVPVPQFVEALAQWSMVIVVFMIFIIIALVIYYKLKMEQKKRDKNPNNYMSSSKLRKTPWF